MPTPIRAIDAASAAKCVWLTAKINALLKEDLGFPLIGLCLSEENGGKEGRKVPQGDSVIL